MLPKDIAEEISLRFCEASKQCDASLRIVMSHQSLGEVKVYGKLVANFMGQSYVNLLRPLWAENPSLKPPGMNQPYVPSESQLSPESRAALESFLSSARASIEFVAQHVPVDQQMSAFAFGGMAEVIEATDAIAAFLEKPRSKEL
jgi:hypothetical protein